MKTLISFLMALAFGVVSLFLNRSRRTAARTSAPIPATLVPKKVRFVTRAGKPLVARVIGQKGGKLCLRRGRYGPIFYRQSGLTAWA